MKVLDKVLSWKSWLLSFRGKIVLIKHILYSIPIHLLGLGVMPKGVFKLFERDCANFLWGSSRASNKFHWLKWKDLCYPSEESGAGFRSISDTYRAFSCKL